MRGDVVEIFPAYEETAVRVELWGDEIENISIIDPLTGKKDRDVERVFIYPAKHFVTTVPQLEKAVLSIREELKERLSEYRKQNRLVEAKRLVLRTIFDIDRMLEVGYCSGIENYSRHLSGRLPGQPPYTLFEYFPKDFLLIIDESHVTIPQVRGMFNGDRARKEILVDYGFRLPSALDNRPLQFDEFEARIHQAVFVSATPADYELEKSGGVFVEQVIRPTGLVDPEIAVRPVKGQIDDLVEEIRLRVENGERVLVTTLTKRMAEDLTDYLSGLDIKVRYIHSEIDALERVDILRSLRLAEFDVLVGVNLLREGLDLPEVSLVAILDADKEGFLRSERSLIQISGRAARNKAGMVILYADEMTGSMQRAMEESERRRTIQLEYNQKMGIEPKSVVKSVQEVLLTTSVADSRTAKFFKESRHDKKLSRMEYEDLLEKLEAEMKNAAKKMEFERAAELRDEIVRLKELHVGMQKGEYS